MKRQIAKIFNDGTWSVVYDDTAKQNAYSIYHTYYECFDNAPAKKHKKRIASYDTLTSCLLDLIKRFDPYIGFIPYNKGGAL